MSGLESSVEPAAKTRGWYQRRLLALVGFGLLCIGGACFYVYFWLYHPIGSGPAGPAVDRKPFEEVWSEREVVLIGFGDSIAQGYGASPGKSFFERLVTNPDDEFPGVEGIALDRVLPNLTSKNYAISGTTSIEHRETLLDRVPVYPEETFGIIVATIGGNDVIHMYGRTPPREGAMYGATMQQAEPWIENFKVRLDEILDELGAKFPGGYRIYLANIYDPTDGIGDAENAGLPAWSEGLKVLGAYNAVIEKVCETRDDTTLVDIRAEFLGHGIHALQFWRPFYHAEDPGYWYYANLEDPNDRGYDAIRRLFLIEMAKELPELLEK